MSRQRHDEECELNEPCYRHGRDCQCGCGCALRENRARIDADNARIRAELHDRLNRLDDHHIDALAHELADTVPDAVVDALNEIGA